MKANNDLLAVWRQQQQLGSSDDETLRNHACDGLVWYKKPEQYIARLAQIHTTKITSAQSTPPTTPTLSIVRMMLLLGMMLGSPWLSPWLNRVLSVPQLLLLLVAVMLLFFCLLLYPYFAHPRRSHRHGYQLWFYPSTGAPLLAITLSDLEALQALQAWLHSHMPPSSMCENRLNADVIQDWLAEQQPSLMNYELLANLRAHKQVVYWGQQELLLLKFTQSLHIHKVEGRYQPPALNRHSDAIGWHWYMVLVGLYFYLPDTPVPNHWLWAVFTLVALLSVLLIKITLPAQYFAGFKKSRQSEPDTHYLLLATNSLEHMDVQIAASYDFSLLMGLRDLLLQLQNPSQSPPNE